MQVTRGKPVDRGPCHDQAAIVVIALLAGLTLFPLASGASAQVTTATIVGTVLDSSGGALPGVTVTARNVDTGFTHSVPSSETGAYRLEFLPDRPLHRRGHAARVQDRPAAAASSST